MWVFQIVLITLIAIVGILGYTHMVSYGVGIVLVLMITASVFFAKEIIGFAKRYL